jgi:hypothetical protein
MFGHVTTMGWRLQGAAQSGGIWVDQLARKAHLLLEFYDACPRGFIP